MKSTEKTVARLFEWIRDMPFEVSLGNRNYHEELARIKTHRKGSCSQKHYLLGSICEGLELPVKYLTHPFYWKDLPVVYPDPIRQLAEKMPVQYHLAIQVSINRKEFLLDATWDSSLAGFPVNQLDEGLVNTRVGIIPCGEPVIHLSPLERDWYIKEIVVGMVKTGVESEFYSRLNQWLEETRKKTTK